MLFGIFLNPKSGNGESDIIGKQIGAFLQQKHFQIQIFLDDWPQDINSFNEAWIVGGDGTLNFFVNKYPDAKCTIALFKAGSGNDFAWFLYGNLNWKQQLAQMLTFKTKAIDAGICNNKFFLNTIGIGFDGEVVRKMNNIKFIKGYAKYLSAVLRTIITYREPLYEIVVDGKLIQSRYLLCIVANAKRAGGGFLVSPNSITDDGKLNLILSEPLSIINRIKHLPAIKKGNHLSLPFIEEMLVKEILINSKNILSAHIDGEFLQSSEFKITVKKAAFVFRYSE